MDGSCVGIQLGNARDRNELPVGAPEDAPCMGCDVDAGDLLSGLSSARGGGAEACFDGVGLSGQHSVPLGVRDDIRSVRGSSEGVGGLGV